MLKFLLGFLSMFGTGANEVAMHSLDPMSFPLLNAVTQNPQQPQDQKNQISATRQGNIRSDRSISHGDRSSTGGSFLVSTVPTVHWKGGQLQQYPSQEALFLYNRNKRKKLHHFCTLSTGQGLVWGRLLPCSVGATVWDACGPSTDLADLICFCGREYFPRWSPDALYFGP